MPPPDDGAIAKKALNRRAIDRPGGTHLCLQSSCSRPARGRYSMARRRDRLRDVVSHLGNKAMHILPSRTALAAALAIALAAPAVAANRIAATSPTPEAIEA